MANYKGRRTGTRRIVINHQGKQQEWIIEGSKAEGEKFEAQKKLEFAAMSNVRRLAPQFAELCQMYRAHAEIHLKAYTWKIRIYQVATLCEFFGKMRLDAIRVADVERYQRLRTDEGLCATSVNNELRVLSVLLNFARARGFELPIVKWKRLRARRSDRVRFWTRAELQRILETARRLFPPRFERLLIFLANTGCRKCEALQCQWDWFDFDKGLLHIPATEDWQPKSGRSRDIPISDALRAALTGPREHPRWVFVSDQLDRYAYFPEHSLRAVLHEAGLTGSPHQFRHSFAAHFLEATHGDIYLLAEILGHSTIFTTQMYAHLLPGRLQKAHNAVNVAPATMLVSQRPASPLRGQCTANRQSQTLAACLASFPN